MICWKGAAVAEVRESQRPRHRHWCSAAPSAPPIPEAPFVARALQSPRARVFRLDRQGFRFESKEEAKCDIGGSVPDIPNSCKYFAVMTAGCIWVASTPTPWGPAWIAAGDAGVVALELMTTAEAFEAGLARRRFGTVRHAGSRPRSDEVDAGVTLALLAGERVAAALEGEDAGLEELPVDISDRPAWDQAVLEAVHAIPRGETVSYGEIARRIGRSGAAQAVGGAVGRNPVGLLIPCHRVIAANGTLGGYGVAAFGGREAALEIKRRLLALEGTTQPRGTGRIG